MARKPTLSPTRFSTFLACPVKYKWTYVDPRGRRYMRARNYYSFGSTLHKVLERFHDEGDVGVTTEGDAIRVYEESWIDAGYRSQEEMEQALGEGREIVENYVRQSLERAEGAKVLAVERTYRHDMGDFTLLGRVDRVDRYPDGRIDVVDYKSGRSSVSKEQIQGDLALGIYQLLLKKHYPEANVTTSIYALRAGSQATTALSDSDLEGFEQDLLELGAQVLNTNWEEMQPVPKALCADCDFLPLCKQYPEYDVREIPSPVGRVVHTDSLPFED